MKSKFKQLNHSLIYYFFPKTISTKEKRKRTNSNY